MLLNQTNTYIKSQEQVNQAAKKTTTAKKTPKATKATKAAVKGSKKVVKDSVVKRISKSLLDSQGVVAPKVENGGTVLTVNSGVATISGLMGAKSGELIKIKTISDEKGSIEFISAMVILLKRTHIGVVILGSQKNVLAGCAAYLTRKIVNINVSFDLAGRIVDGLGNFIDGGKKLDPKHAVNRAVDVKAPGIVHRAKITQPLLTGILALDSMVPVGKGQRELIIGDKQTGKTAVAVDTIINQGIVAQSGEPVVSCIYVSIGQKRSSIGHIWNTFKHHGADKYTTIVAATASESASIQYLAPYTGCTIGEFYRDNGFDALIVYDDLSKQAIAYRQMSLLLRRAPGREAYPADVFYLHSRLLERAAQMNSTGNYFGGSLTALPIVETQAGDVAAFVPTNVISITDGQIFLESEIFYKGVRPAINVGLSVSRVGTAAQSKAMKVIAGTLKLELAMYREVEAFASFDGELDETTRQTLHRGTRLVELLKQHQYSPQNTNLQVFLLCFGVRGFLDDLSLTQVSRLKNFIFHLDAQNASLQGFAKFSDWVLLKDWEIVDRFLAVTVAEFIKYTSK